MTRKSTNVLFGIADLRKVAGSVIMGALVLLGSALPAKAVTYNLTSDHCTGAGGCGTAPFGTVTLTQNGTTVDVTVHLLNNNAFAKTGAADDQAFKFNMTTGHVLANITVDAHSPALVADAGAYNGDGTGNFAFGIACPICASGASGAFSNDIVFHVATATIADLTVPNFLGNVFVVDLYSPATGNTGPVDASTPGGGPGQAVPEPTSVVLLGTALLFAGKLLKTKLAV